MCERDDGWPGKSEEIRIATHALTPSDAFPPIAQPDNHPSLSSPHADELRQLHGLPPPDDDSPGRRARKYVSMRAIGTNEEVITKGEGPYRTHIGFVDVFLEYLFSYRERVFRFQGRTFYSERSASVALDSHLADLKEAEDAVPKRLSQWREHQRHERKDIRQPGGKLKNPFRESGDPYYEKQYLNAQKHLKRLLEMPQAVDELYPIEEDAVKQHVCVEVKIKPVPLGDVLRQIKLYAAYLRASHSEVVWVLVTRYPMREQDIDQLRKEGVHHAQLGEEFLAFAEAYRNTPGASSPQL